VILGYIVALDYTVGFAVVLDCTAGFAVVLDCTAGSAVVLDCTVGVVHLDYQCTVHLDSHYIAVQKFHPDSDSVAAVANSHPDSAVKHTHSGFAVA